MCMYVEGQVLNVQAKTTSKGTSFRELQILVNHGRYQEILNVADFSGMTVEKGQQKIPVIGKPYSSKAGRIGINWHVNQNQGS